MFLLAVVVLVFFVGVELKDYHPEFLFVPFLGGIEMGVEPPVVYCVRHFFAADLRVLGGTSLARDRGRN